MRALAVLLLLAACSPDIEQSVHPARNAEPAPSANLASQDRDFLERAAQGHTAEIAIGGLALIDGHTNRADIAAFGRLMMADHDAMRVQLARIAAAKHIALPTGLGEHQQNFDRVVDLRGEDFDREFVKVMLGDHQEAVRLYRGEAENGTDAELKAYAAAMLPRIEGHLHGTPASSPAEQGASRSRAPEDGGETPPAQPAGRRRSDKVRAQ